MYLAHRSEDGREQPLSEHLHHVGQLAGDFAESFGSKDWGFACGILHDIGKYSEEFQKRIRGDECRVDHSTAGAIEMKTRKCFPAAYCIAGHHAGLPDGGSPADESGSATLQGRLKKRVPDYGVFQKEIEPSLPSSPKMSVLDKNEGLFGVTFFIRMVFSCLVDADFLDTEQFMNSRQREYSYASIDELWKRLEEKIAPWLEGKEKDTINAHRTEILRACMKKGEEEQGIYHMTVPTGGGKTIASLAFGLRQAKKHKLNRIIYVLPYTSIIEQNAKVFEDILGAEQVLEDHCNAEYEDREELELKNLAAENWDVPIVVTTNVQFFESLFSNKPSKCRKLHNIAGSVLIFDEAQMLPKDFLKPCMRAVSELVLNYRCTAVLCTATQPALGKMLPDCLFRGEICPDVENQYTFFRRTHLVKEGKWTTEELISRLNNEKQTLCILNTRRRVQEIYEALQGKEGLYHLSTYMYPMHRRKKLEEIKSRLKAGRDCVVIATSLVEAGVDLDFQTVYRELAGLDSLLQAAGRCNREGKRSLLDSRTHVFQFADEKEKGSNEVRQAAAVSEQILREFEDISSLNAIHTYFERLFYVKGEGLDKKTILDKLNGAHVDSIPFGTVAKDFRIIDRSGKTILICDTEEGKKLAETLRYGMRSRQLMREIGKYSVNVYDGIYENLRAAGLLEDIDEETAVLRDLRYYSEDIGLKADVGRGVGVFL